MPDADIIEAEHPLRASVLGELHARPFPPIGAPHRVVRLAYGVGPAGVAGAAAAFRTFAERQGIPAPPDGFKHHRSVLDAYGIAFEAHTEFVTLTIDRAAPEGFDQPAALAFRDVLDRLPKLPRLLVAIDLAVSSGTGDEIAQGMLAASRVDAGKAVAASDFRPDADGFVRMRLAVVETEARRFGALAQSLVEIETYRCFAQLGLPEAQKRGPLVGRIERELAALSKELTTTKDLTANESLLDRLTGLAASLEADAAESAFRFRASLAYESLVEARLQALGEQSIGTLPTIGAFLRRRFAPAMRTCESLMERQADLSTKLQRAAGLLRTRVDVDMERQNGKVLEAMNDRARQQLRLQQTVEGLSIAAISYYIVGLVGYVAKGAADGGWPINVGLTVGLSVPVVLAVVALVLRRIRRSTEA